MSTALVVLVVISLAVTAFSAWAQWRQLRRPILHAGAAAPPISVLKPLKGADFDLRANLLSFFQQDYPCFELVFGAQDPGDPALGVVHQLAAEHPWVRVRVVTGGRRGGLNPKVENLAGMLPAAAHEVLVISDSNVRVGPGYLDDLAAHLGRPGVGLVSSPIRAADASGAGGILEALQLDTFVMRGVSAWNGLFGQPCVVGKSMALRRADLALIGGFEELGRYLAEDQVSGLRLHAAGRRVVVSGMPVTNVLGPLALRDFAARHLRWALIRRRICPGGYAAELLLNPVPLALVVAAVLGGSAWWLPVAALAAMTLMAAETGRRVGSARPVAATALAELGRSLAVAVLWPVPFVTTSVRWRGRRLRVGAMTQLEGVPVDLPSGSSPEPTRA